MATSYQQKHLKDLGRSGGNDGMVKHEVLTFWIKKTFTQLQQHSQLICWRTTFVYENVLSTRGRGHALHVS